jgi:NAD(P)-dependent dehydrogenase (short-subunit alcohol dehydrogenase family)
MKSILISGVSTGIGHDAASELCRRGYRVFGSIRDPLQAERLKRELGPHFVPVTFDVTDPTAIKAAMTDIETETGGTGLFGLINNAGISLPGPLASLSPDSLRQHFEVNVIGALHMVQAALPLLRQQAPGPPGRIINISSLSGRIAYPFMGPYAASKHALEALSDSLRRELLIYGVDVIVIEPGAIDTPIWDKAAHIRTAFSDTDYGPVLQQVDLLGQRRAYLRPAVVSRCIVHALTARRPKTRYAIPDRLFRYWILPRALPDRWLDRVIDRMMNFQSVRDALRRP